MRALIVPIALALIVYIELASSAEEDSSSTEEDPIESQLENQLSTLSGFKIRAKITKYRYAHLEKFPTFVTDVLEYHSNDLELSRFEYKREDKKWGEMEQANQVDEFYTIDEATTLRVDRSDRSCRLVEQKQGFFTMLYRLESCELSDLMMALFHGKADQFEPTLTPPPDKASGLARLLFLLDLNAHKLKNLSTKLYAQAQVSDLYKLDVQLRGNKDDMPLKLHLYYPISQSLHLAGVRFPRRVKINWSPQCDIMVDFLELEPIGSVKQVEPERDAAQVDVFSIDPRFGCAQAGGIRHTLAPMQASHRLSMHFEALDLRAGPNELYTTLHNERHFVAYDGRLSAFRRDIIQKSDSSHDKLQSSYSVTIHDLKGEKKYNLRGSSCVAAKTSANHYEPLFPFADLAYLGTGTVRGIKVDLYQQQARGRLPALFFSQGRYVDIIGVVGPAAAAAAASDGTSQSAQMVEQPAPDSIRSLLVVYQFGRTGEPSNNRALGPLVRVDVYLEKTGEHVSQINVFDFVWQLQPAPNGDPMDALFALPDECVGPQDRHTSQELRLQLDHASEDPIGVQVVQRALSTNTKGRDKALMSALATQTPISTTQIRHLRSSSRLLSDASTNRPIGIRVNLATRLTQMGGQGAIDLYQPAEVVFVSPHRTVAAQWSSQAASYEQCFFEAAHERKRSGQPVLFAFQLGRCFLDRKPIYDMDAKTNRHSFTYSNVFKIHRVAKPKNLASNRPAFWASEILVEREPQSALLFNSIDNRLRGQKVTLSMALVSPAHGNSAPSTIDFKVNSAQLMGDHSDRPIQHLDGITFSSGLAWDTMQGGATEEELADCHAACLADSKCWSFSFCTRNAQTQCLLSSVRKAELSQMVDQARTITDNRLEVDRRCHIYLKAPLELFNAETKHRMVTPSTRWMSYGEEVADCAERCLSVNNLLREEARQSGTTRGGQPKAEHELEQHGAKLAERWCDQFEYVSLEQLESATPQQPIQDLLKMLDPPASIAGQHGGVCLMSKRLMMPEDHKNLSILNSDNLVATVASYNFKYSSLYERQQSISMVATRSDKGNLADGGPLVNEQKVVGIKSIDDCARACFMQTAELVPLCGSFDIIVTVNERVLSFQGSNASVVESKLYNKETLCILNSMTLAEAKASDQYDKFVKNSHDFDGQRSIWHYEPRLAHSLRHTLYSRDFQTTNRPDKSYKKLDILINVIAYACIVSFAIISGALIVKRLELRMNDMFLTKMMKRDSTISLKPHVSTG